MSEESDALLHIADDHPCCKPTLLWAHNRLLELERENAELREALPKPDKQGVLFGTIWLSYDKILGLETEDEMDRAKFYQGIIPRGFVEWARKARATLGKEAQP